MHRVQGKGTHGGPKVEPIHPFSSLAGSFLYHGEQQTYGQPNQHGNAPFTCPKQMPLGHSSDPKISIPVSQSSLRKTDFGNKTVQTLKVGGGI